MGKVLVWSLSIFSAFLMGLNCRILKMNQDISNLAILITLFYAIDLFIVRDIFHLNSNRKIFKCKEVK